MQNQSHDSIRLPDSQRIPNFLDNMVDRQHTQHQMRPQDVRKAMSRIIAHHRDIDALLSEGESSIHTAPSLKFGPNLSVQGILRTLTERASVQRTQVADVAVTVCASRLQEILSSHDPSKPLLDAQCRAQWQVMIEVMRSIQDSPGFNRHNFSGHIIKQKNLPVEVLWTLHKENIISLEIILTSGTDVLRTVSSSIPVLCMASEDSQDLDITKNIITDVMSQLIQLAYGEQAVSDEAARHLRKICVAVLDKIAKRYIQLERVHPELHLFALVMHPQLQLDAAALKKFSQRTITLLLGLNPELQVLDAVAEQGSWTYAKTPELVRGAYEHLLLPLEVGEALQLLRSILEAQEVNWQALLSFLAVYLVCFEDAPSRVKDAVAEYLDEGLENNEMEGLITGFLLARQACYEGPHVFPSYQEWFGNTFGDSVRSPANSRKSFSFLMRFLTNVMPIESALCLKAHLLRTPFVPAKCRPLLTDYTILAKTRLADLQESLEEGGIYNEGSSSMEAKAGPQEQVLQDVQRALASFTATGKVPASLMEASIFRKPYFIGRFMPALLTPRPLPDIPDDRMKLIEALQRSDKIPLSLFMKYEKACKRESALLLEGMFEEEDEDDLSDLLLTPAQQVKVSLANFADKVTQCRGRGSGVAAALSIVSEKLHNFAGTEASSVTHPTAQTIHLDNPPGQEHLKMVDLLLNTVCEILAVLEDSGEPSSGDWLPQLAAVIPTHHALLPTFLARIWNLFTQSSAQLDVYHIRGLAALLLHFTSVPQLLNHITLKAAGTQGQLLELLMARLMCHTCEQMLFTLRFCVSYLQQAFTAYKVFSLHHRSSETAVTPPVLIKLFTFLTRRLFGDSKTCVESRVQHCSDEKLQAIAMEMCTSNSFQQLENQCRLTFREWINYELCIAPSYDIFHVDYERISYYEEVYYAHYTTSLTEDGVFTACTVLTRELLKYDCKNSEPCRCVNITSPSASQTQHTCSGQDSSHSCHGNSRMFLVQFLQSLCQSLPIASVSGDIGSSSWLLQVFADHFTDTDMAQQDNLMYMQHCVSCFMSLVLALPPYLFFCSQPGAEATSVNVSAAVELTNQHLRNHLCGTLVLPKVIVMYILQALDSLGEAEVGRVHVKTYLQGSGIALTSLLYHWPHLGVHVLQRFSHNPVLRPYLTQIDTLATLGPRCTSEPRAWFRGFSAYCQLVWRNLPVSDLIFELSTSEADSPTCQECCLAAILAHLAKVIVSGQPMSREPVLLEASCELLLNSACLPSHRPEGGQPSWVAVLPDNAVKLLPAAGARVLLHAGANQITSSVCKNSQLLINMIELHQQCGKLYDELTCNTPSQTQLDTPLVDCSLVVQLSDLLRTVISHLPRQTLESIPKVLLERADPDIRMAVQHRMAR